MQEAKLCARQTRERVKTCNPWRRGDHDPKGKPTGFAGTGVNHHLPLSKERMRRLERSIDLGRMTLPGVALHAHPHDGGKRPPKILLTCAPARLAVHVPPSISRRSTQQQRPPGRHRRDHTPSLKRDGECVRHRSPHGHDQRLCGGRRCHFLPDFFEPRR